MKSRKTNQYISVKTDWGYERVKYRTRDDRPIWELMKEFINERVQTGKLFKRKNMLEYMYPGLGHEMCSLENTADHYRCLLGNDNVRILQATDTLGVYKKLRDIPDGFTTTRLKEIARDKSWRQWFIPIEEKVKA